MDMDSERDQIPETHLDDQGDQPPRGEPDRPQRDGDMDAPQPDPGPAKNHGDPLTDIDDEIRGGGGGND